MSIRERPGTSILWCRFEVGGKTIRRSTHTRDRRAAAAFERKLRAEFDTASTKRRRGSVTLARLGALDVKRAATDGTTDQHQRAIEWQWAQICKHFGGDSDPSAVSLDAVSDYVAARRKHGALGQTITREIARLWWGLAYAYDHGWMSFPPPTRPRVKRDPKGQKRRGKLHQPSVIALWLRELHPDARGAAVVMAFTSLRVTECRRLTAEWVEPAPEGSPVPAVLRVPAACAKDRKERVLPLVRPALAAIKQMADAMADAGAPPSLPLFPHDHKRAFKSACKRIGYTGSISPRDLRHTWATLAGRNTGIDAARDMLGHADISTTNNYLTAGLDRTTQAALAIEAQVVTEKPSQSPKALGGAVLSQDIAGESASQAEGRGFEPRCPLQNQAVTQANPDAEPAKTSNSDLEPVTVNPSQWQSWWGAVGLDLQPEELAVLREGGDE